MNPLEERLNRLENACYAVSQFQRLVVSPAGNRCHGCRKRWRIAVSGEVIPGNHRNA